MTLSRRSRWRHTPPGAGPLRTEAVCLTRKCDLHFVRRGVHWSSAASFLSYAVGPWVSVAGRETALVRGNPAKKDISDFGF